MTCLLKYLTFLGVGKSPAHAWIAHHNSQTSSFFCCSNGGRKLPFREILNKSSKNICPRNIELQTDVAVQQ